MAQKLKVTSTCGQVRDLPLADNQMAVQYKYVINNLVRATIDAPTDPTQKIQAVVEIDRAVESQWPPLESWVAYDEHGASSASPPRPLVVPDNEDPEIVSDFHVTSQSYVGGVLTVHLAWNQAHDQGGAMAASYQIQVEVGPSVEVPAPADPLAGVQGTVAIDTATYPTLGGVYILRCLARDAATPPNTSLSAPVAVNLPDAIPPATPEGLHLTAAQWTDPFYMLDLECQQSIDQPAETPAQMAWAYRLAANGEVIATVPAPASVSDPVRFRVVLDMLGMSESVLLQVAAVDEATPPNVSGYSPPVEVMTPTVTAANGPDLPLKTVTWG